MIHYLTLAGRWMFPEYLEYWGRELAQSQIRVLSYEHLLTETRFEPGTYVFTTFDEIRGVTAQYVEALAARLSESPDVRIFNDPRQVVRRFDLQTELWRRGRNAFRSFRATEDRAALRFPAFVRAESSHDGALSPLLRSHSDVDTWIGRSIALGRRIDDLLVVEFCDTAGADGSYRKYAAFNVGGCIVARSLNLGRHWMLKFGGNDFSPAFAREELEYVRANPYEAALAMATAAAAVPSRRGRSTSTRPSAAGCVRRPARSPASCARPARRRSACSMSVSMTPGRRWRRRVPVAAHRRWTLSSTLTSCGQPKRSSSAAGGPGRDSSRPVCASRSRS
jgi:hypothetical protein